MHLRKVFLCIFVFASRGAGRCCFGRRVEEISSAQLATVLCLYFRLKSDYRSVNMLLKLAGVGVQALQFSV